MAFTVQDYHDLVRLLAEHPEWRSELRRLVLSDELLALPEVIRALTSAQQKTEEGLGALVKAQERTEERLARLEETVATLARQIQLLAEQVQALADHQKRLVESVGDFKGRRLEMTYREHLAHHIC